MRRVEGSGMIPGSNRVMVKSQLKLSLPSWTFGPNKNFGRIRSEEGVVVAFFHLDGPVGITQE